MTGPAAPAPPPTYPRTWPVRAHQVLARLPAGTVEAGRCSVGAGLHVLGEPAPAAGPTGSWTDARWVAERLIEPLLLVDDWPEPTPPLPVGDGAVHADLIDEDHELFAGLRHALADAGEPLEAERLAAAAQELRLPVTPYRRRGGPAAGPQRHAVARGPDVVGGRRWGGPDGTPLVVDLTALWAGPLATSLLARLGAEVVKVDPACRPDALQEQGPVYGALNAGKTIVDLDLRRPADRARFEELVTRADLVVDSFSRRVMPNLGYGPSALHQRFDTATLSIVAFPAGTPEEHWVSYGPGVHAMSGLAYSAPSPDGLASSPVTAAPIAYPDVLAGLAGFAAAAELLAGDQPPAHREVSLAGALAPLVEGEVRT